MKISLIENLRVPEEQIHQLAEPLIKAGHEFVYYPEKTNDPDELLDRCQGAEIVMLANNPLPASVVKQLDQTQYLNVAFTGLDHIPLELAKEKEISVSNAAGYSNTAVAELVIGLTLNLMRQIKQSDQDVRTTSSFPGMIQGQEIKGKTVGIIGVGKIGIETARLFKAFGANLIGHSHSESPEALDLGMSYLTFEEVLKESDILSLHLPLNEETKGMLNAECFKMMKKDALFINCARGPIVDNQALAEALNSEEIAGAGIDVYDMEPPLTEDYPLLTAKNTLLTPHIGYLTDQAMEKRAQIVFENTYAYLEGKPQNLA